MTRKQDLPEVKTTGSKPLPTFSTDEDGSVRVHVPEEGAVSKLFNVETSEAAGGLLKSLLNALARQVSNTAIWPSPCRPSCSHMMPSKRC